MKHLLASCSLALVLGCVGSNPDESHLELYGKDPPDIFQIDDGALAVANTVSAEILSHPSPDGVGLGAAPVGSLIAVRLGPDGRLGSEDDGHVDTIAQLDALPFVESIEIDKLRTYALDHGFVP